jgi:outer membrane protein
MKTTVTLLAAAAALTAASSALAQAAQPARPAAQPARPAQAAPAQAALPSRPGPNIAGVCVVDTEAAIAASQVGRAYQARMQTLTQQVQAELQPEQTALQTEANAVAALPAGQPKTTRQTALQTRANTFQNKVELRSRELQATQARQLQRLGTEARPVLDQVYGQRNCGILIARDAVVAFNPAMDITNAVTQALNTRIQTITFDRERADQQQAAPRAQ